MIKEPNNGQTAMEIAMNTLVDLYQKMGMNVSMETIHTEDNHIIFTIDYIKDDEEKDSH